MAGICAYRLHQSKDRGDYAALEAGSGGKLTLFNIYFTDLPLLTPEEFAEVWPDIGKLALARGRRLTDEDKKEVGEAVEPCL